MTPNHPNDGSTAGPAPLAVDAAAAARLFGVSLRSWRRWDSSGRCPAGFRIGKRALWRLDDLRRWAADGFPRRGRGRTDPAPGLPTDAADGS